MSDGIPNLRPTIAGVRAQFLAIRAAGLGRFFPRTGGQKGGVLVLQAGVSPDRRSSARLPLLPTPPFRLGPSCPATLRYKVKVGQTTALAIFLARATSGTRSIGSCVGSTGLLLRRRPCFGQVLGCSGDWVRGPLNAGVTEETGVVRLTQSPAGVLNENCDWSPDGKSRLGPIRTAAIPRSMS